MNEAEFTRQVLQLAALCGWRTIHLRPALTRHDRWVTPVQGDGVGFPDIFAIHPGRGVVLAAELKIGRRKPTPAQTAWLDAMRAAGIAAYCWVPADWKYIEAVLKGENVR